MRITLFTIICFCIIAGCATNKSFFKTSNNCNKVRGTIYMNDGTVKNGLITINFENVHERDNGINIVSDTSNVGESLDVKKINFYTINGKWYVPKIIDVRLGGEKHLLFVERLTAENAKMALYKLFPSENSVVSGEEPFYYYISLPSLGKYDAIDINSSKLVPFFDLKMAAYITDCPDLKAKIQAKEKNYYYTLLSFGGKRTDAIKNIVQEYNNCK